MCPFLHLQDLLAYQVNMTSSKLKVSTFYGPTPNVHTVVLLHTEDQVKKGIEERPLRFTLVNQGKYITEQLQPF